VAIFFSQITVELNEKVMYWQKPATENTLLMYGRHITTTENTLIIVLEGGVGAAETAAKVAETAARVSAPAAE
jgi:hypothetical protein